MLPKEAGASWLKALPRLLGRLEVESSINVGRPFPHATEAFVSEAVTADGRLVALKVPIAGLAKADREQSLLQTTGGRGYVRLLRHDADSGAMLLERLGPQLATLGLPIEEQIRIICRTLKQAWMPLPSGVSFPTGADKASEMLSYISTLWPRLGRPCSEKAFEVLDRIERQYGKARRVWVMDRGVPTEEVLAEMRAADPPMHYLVGTPKGRLTRLEKHLIAQPWQEARPGVQVKLLAQEGELYVLAQSRDRVAKERAMRRRQLKRLWARLKQLSTMRLTREELLMKLGAARDQSRTAWRLVTIAIAAEDATFSYRLDRNKLRQIRLREGRYLLRTNLVEEDPTKLWHHYLLLMAVEEAFKNLKGDLAIRPVFHQLEARIEAHVFIAFLAYCLHVTLARRLHALAPGLTPRSVLEKFAAMQMIDVHLPTTDGRELVLTRCTEPEAELRLLLQKLKLELPAQPPPRITAAPPTRL